MSRMYTAEVIADSISPDGHRLTTVSVVYPHAVHKDMLRHRCMNRNVESFRAQPPEKIIENLRNGHAFKPEVFAKRTKGMGQGEEIITTDAVRASFLWQTHVLQTLDIAKQFLEMGIAKQQVNFLLQDLCPLTEIITATDWSNFYALRTELKDDGTPVARPEVYLTAKAIREAIEASTPIGRDYDQWHLPLLTDQERPHALDDGETDFWVHVSAGRTARWSYGEFRWWEENPETSLARSARLLTAGHMSPFEQQAKPFSKKRWNLIERLHYALDRAEAMDEIEKAEMKRQLLYSGNLHGWVPARKTMAGEYDYGILKAFSKP